MGNGVIYVNDRMVPADGLHLSALDRGFSLGDGVFETLRVVGGSPFRLGDHYARLHRSAAAVGLAVPFGLEEMRSVVSAVLSANDLRDALVRITLSRGVPEERGLLPPASPAQSFVVQAHAFVGYPEERYQKGSRVVIATVRRNETSPLSYIKSCSYLDSVLARMEAHRRGGDEALLLNTSGWVACGTSSNLFLAFQGSLVTPSLDCGVLDGVTRRTVLDLARGLQVECVERRISLDELRSAEEAFLTNCAIGVMPVVAVDNHPIGQGAPGPLCRKIRSAYTRLLHNDVRPLEGCAAPRHE